MPIVKNVQDFAERLEKEFMPEKDRGMWRQSWCTPADLSSTGLKVYNFERPSATPEQIAKLGVPKADPEKPPHPGRGYMTRPSWALKNDDTGDLKNAVPCLSIYLKYVKDLFVVDFDTMDKCIYEDRTDDDGNITNHNPLFKHLVDAETPYIETAKGYHFYVLIPDIPDFSSGLKCAKEPDTMGDVDIIGRKGVPGEKNIIEQKHHELSNGDAPIHRIPWDEFKEYLNLSVFFGDNKNKDKTLSKKERAESVSIHQGDHGLPEDQFIAYLSRLRKTDDPSDETKKSRWHYLEYVKVGMVCWTNFADKDQGFQVWMNWVRSDPDVAIATHDHHARTFALLSDKWKSFGETENPMTWKTLRQWANEDDPVKNIYQEIYDQGGIQALVLYMNSFIKYNKKTSEYLYDDPDDCSEYASLTYYKQKDASETFCCHEIFVPGQDGEKGKMFNPFSLWRKNPVRNVVSGITFDPSPYAPKNYHNLFQGFRVDETQTLDIDMVSAEIEVKPLLDHIKYVWCKGNQQFYDFVLNWFSFIVQRPYKKIGVLLCVKSKEGSGKGIVFDYMRHILGGRLYAQINSLDAITGKNNSILEGRLLINGDEVIWGGSVKDGNAMKGIITEEEIWIEEKYRAKYKVKNTTAFCMSSNEDRAMSAREGDRRSFGLELSNKWAGRQKSPAHKKYFCDISGCAHHGVAQDKVLAFAKILYNRDLTSFDVRNPPMTDFVSDQMERNMTPVQKFWYGMLHQGRFTIDPKFKKATAITEESEYGPKTTWKPYDDAQLEYGNVSQEWGSGIKEEQDLWVYKEPKAPVYGYAFYPGSDYSDTDRYYCEWKNKQKWFKVLEYIKAEGLYPDMPESLASIPMPEWAPEEFGFDCARDTLRQEDCPYEKLTEDNTFHEKKREGHYDGQFSCVGLHLGCVQPGGVKPKIRKGQQGNTPEWMFCRELCHLHIGNLLAPGAYEKITKMRDCQEGVQEDYEASPVNYYRKSAPFAKCERKRSKTHGEELGEKWEVEITDEDAMKKYLDKWSRGVNPDNFSMDLVGRPLFDEDGNQMFLTDYVPKKTRWVYEKDWVFERYKESSGIGYGQDNITSGEFWKSICEMLGGDADAGGKYKSFRLRNASDRKTYIKIVPLEVARQEFEKNAGRLVNWADDAEEDNEEYEW